MRYDVKRILPILALLMCFSISLDAFAQRNNEGRRSQKQGDRQRKTKTNQNQFGAPDTSKQEKIAWFSTLESALAEAKRTQRPIFMTAARPECQGVPGIW